MAQKQSTKILIPQEYEKSFWFRWDQWGLWTLITFYLALLAFAILLPGASLLDRLRWLDSGICAQLLTHSFFAAGERLPLCARNTGIYLGFILTLITLYATGRGRIQRLPPRSILIVLACGVTALAIDGLNSLALDLRLPHLYQPDNLLRLATGLVTGLAMALVLLPALNHMLWKDYDQHQSVLSWKTLTHFLPILLLCFFVVASQSGYMLYPVALLSTIGVVAALGSVNMIFLVILSKRDGTCTQYREVFTYFGIATLLAIGELLLLAQLKLTLLQTFGLNM